MWAGCAFQLLGLRDLWVAVDGAACARHCPASSPASREVPSTPFDAPAAGIRMGAMTMPPAGLSTAAPSRGGTPPAPRAAGPLQRQGGRGEARSRT